MSDDQFDVLFFAEGDVGQSDYDCYIEKSMMWVEHQEAEACEFVTERPDTIKQQVKEWSNSDDMFLSKDQVHSDVFVVLDNTGYIQRVTDKNLKNI